MIPGVESCGAQQEIRACVCLFFFAVVLSISAHAGTLRVRLQ